VLPWLSLEDVLAGVETLGALTQNQEEAAALRARLESRLDVPANPNGVRLLLRFGAPSFEGGDVWYAKRNSLHGAAIHAAGARNAIDRDVSGAPTLSVEELLAQDPDVVILMVPEPELSPEGRMAMVQSFGRLEALRAARDGKIGFLVGAEYMRTGPDILDTVDALQSELARLSKGGG